MGSKIVTIMQGVLVVFTVLAALVASQDSYHCPDDWEWQEHNGHGHCFFFSTEQVTKQDAEILCSFHEGWLLEIDRPALNYWIKAQLLEKYTEKADAKVPWGNQFWMGAVTMDHHNDHVNGNWMWPKQNVSVDWFDWGENEPNDYHTQFCMTYMEWRGIWNKDYFWNDYNCDGVGHYICMKECADCDE